VLTRAASVRSGGRRLAWNLAPYEENGLGTWYLESLLDHGFVGYCGIRPLVLNGKREVELAWHVKKTHWNRGLATEAALTSMRLGFDQFGLSRRVAIINPDNSASRRVAQKLGAASRSRARRSGIAG
jgi:RimJ/RimL family protein N-acetyltransferase